MHCPFCGTEDTKVIDSRLADDGGQVRRRRECVQCLERFTTHEVAELLLPRVVKRDGRRVAFDVEKLKSGLFKALEKRPVSMAVVDRILQRITHQLRTQGEREVSSQVIGEWLMAELYEVDAVAYVRFASVYRCFQDVAAFQEVIARLQNKPEESLS